MTKLEAIEYGVARYNSREIGEEVPTLLYEKDGDFKAVTWDDEGKAEANGWKYSGSIPEEAKKLGLIGKKEEDVKEKKFQVEFGFGENIQQVQEWQTIDGLDNIVAKNAEEAAMEGANTDGLENALFRVSEILIDDFGDTYIELHSAKYFSFR